MDYLILTVLQQLLPQLSNEQHQQLLHLLPAMPQRTWQKNSLIYAENKPFQAVVVIQSGLVRSFYVHDDKEINLRFLCDNSILLPFASGARYWLGQANLIASETIQCVSVLQGYQLPISFFDRPEPLIQQLKYELAMRHYLSMEMRLRMIQLKRASDRYHTFLHTMPAPIVAKMPNFHVASYLGITPETLSRIKEQHHTAS